MARASWAQGLSIRVVSWAWGLGTGAESLQQVLAESMGLLPCSAEAWEVPRGVAQLEEADQR